MGPRSPHAVSTGMGSAGDHAGGIARPPRIGYLFQGIGAIE
jgi:hypothetical protein